MLIIPNITAERCKHYGGFDGSRAELKGTVNSVRAALDFCALNSCPNRKKLFLLALRALEASLSYTLYFCSIVNARYPIEQIRTEDPADG